MNNPDLPLILLPLVLSQIVQYLVPMPRDWYQTLNQSPQEPPGWVFGVVWTILYLIIGYSLTLNLEGTKWLWISLFLGYLWQYIFNGKRNITQAFYVLMVVTITGMIYFYQSQNKLILPYLAWGLFASNLNYYMMNNN